MDCGLRYGARINLSRDRHGLAATASLAEVRRFHAGLEAMRDGGDTFSESIAELLRKGGLTMDEFVERCQLLPHRWRKPPG